MYIKNVFSKKKAPREGIYTQELGADLSHFWYLNFFHRYDVASVPSCTPLVVSNLLL